MSSADALHSADASDYTLCRGQFLLHFMMGWDKNRKAFPLKPAAPCGVLFMLNLTHNKVALLRSHHAVSLWSSHTRQEPQQESSPLFVCLLLTLRGFNLFLRVCPGEHNILPSHLFPDSHPFCPPVSGLTPPHVGAFSNKEECFASPNLKGHHQLHLRKWLITTVYLCCSREAKSLLLSWKQNRKWNNWN